MKIYNKTYNIKSNLNKKIVLISDLHYSSKNDLKMLYKVLNNIKKIEPDCICIPGDIINKSTIKDEDEFLNWLKDVSKICKVIISIGNHEFYVNKRKSIYAINKEFMDKVSSTKNVYLLDNKNIILDNINFIGITAPISHYHSDSLWASKCIKSLNVNNEFYNILLCHSPINICYEEVFKNKNIDLVLCGHMHGGIVPRFLRPLFKDSGLISPNKKLFPQKVYGNIKAGKTNIIITSGIKVLHNSFFTKIFSPEVVTINLTTKINNV